MFCWLAAAAALVTWHVPALFRLGMQSRTWHFIEHASFFATGLLSGGRSFEPWPSRATMAAVVDAPVSFLATLPCDVLSGLLVFLRPGCVPDVSSAHHHSRPLPLEDQQCAAALMWTCVTVVFLVAGTVLSTQLLSAGPEEADSV